MLRVLSILLCAAIAQAQLVPPRPFVFAAPLAAAAGATPLAIGFTTLATASSTTDQAVYSTSVSALPETNALVLLAMVNTKAANPDIPTGVSGLGLNWIPIATVLVNSIATPTMRVSLYRAGGPGPMVPQDVSVHFPANQTGWSARVCEFTNVDLTGFNGSNAVLQVATGSSDSGANPTITLASLDTSGSNAVFAVFGNNANPFAGTPEASWTEDTDTGYATPTTGRYTTYRIGTTDNTVGPTRTATAWGGIAIEIKAGTTGPQAWPVPSRSGSISVAMWEDFEYTGVTSTANLDAQDHTSAGTWTLSDTNVRLTNSTAANHTALGQINSTTDTGTKGLQFGPPWTNSAFGTYTFPVNSTNASMAFWIRFPTNFIATSKEFDTFVCKANADLNDFYLKLNSDSSSMSLVMFHPSTYYTNVYLSGDTWYCVNLKMRCADKFYMTITDYAGVPVQVNGGSETLAPIVWAAGEPFAKIMVGNFGGDYPTLINDKTYYDNFVVDTNSSPVYPLIP